jgi:hypothetical protein
VRTGPESVRALHRSRCPHLLHTLSGSALRGRICWLGQPSEWICFAELRIRLDTWQLFLIQIIIRPLPRGQEEDLPGPGPTQWNRQWTTPSVDPGPPKPYNLYTTNHSFISQFHAMIRSISHVHLERQQNVQFFARLHNLVKIWYNPSTTLFKTFNHWVTICTMLYNFDLKVVQP